MVLKAVNFNFSGPDLRINVANKYLTSNFSIEHMVTIVGCITANFDVYKRISKGKKSCFNRKFRSIVKRNVRITTEGLSLTSTHKMMAHKLISRNDLIICCVLGLHITFKITEIMTSENVNTVIVSEDSQRRMMPALMSKVSTQTM